MVGCGIKFNLYITANRLQKKTASHIVTCSARAKKQQGGLAASLFLKSCFTTLRSNAEFIEGLREHYQASLCIAYVTVFANRSTKDGSPPVNAESISGIPRHQW
jgi:hypothetical protein